MQLASGALATLVATFEAPGHYASSLLVLGSDGTLALPDPNAFEGSVRLRQGRGDWADVAYRSRGAREARGIGLQDLAEAIAAGRAPRASGALAHHVVDVGRSILAAAASGATWPIGTAGSPAFPVEERISTAEGGNGWAPATSRNRVGAAERFEDAGGLLGSPRDRSPLGDAAS